MTSLIPILNPNPPPEPEIMEFYSSRLPRPERVLYRFEINVMCYDGDIRTRVARLIFPVTGETHASWFFDSWGQRRHVLKGNGRRYAHENEEWALFSLRRRTSLRQSHALWALTSAHEAIDAYNALFGGDKPLQKVGSP